MECSPTKIVEAARPVVSRSPRQLWNALLHNENEFPKKQSIVAVPVNYGMLSYKQL